MENNKIISKDDMKLILKNIGELIRTSRQNKGWSMANLANKSGISSSLISDLENNKGKVPNIFTLIAIARALEIPDETFIASIWNNVSPACNKIKPEDKIRTALSEYGVPNVAITNIMLYAKIFARLANYMEIYNLQELVYKSEIEQGTEREKIEPLPELKQAEKELLNLPFEIFNKNED